MAAIIDQYSKQELEQIVQQSHTYKEVIEKLGYQSRSGSNQNTVKNRIEKYGIDVSHFSSNVQPIKRTEENVFCVNSTASQQTLRRWYKKGNYTSHICSICGQPPLWQGKELTLILDHINGICNDNRLENLRWVCPNCNQQLETTGFKQMRVERTHNIQKKFYCIECGKEISSNHAKRCKSCADKLKQVKIEDMPVSREELKELIRTTPFTQIGKKYTVTDNAIRKWCDKFNLPRTKKEINSYDDAEWSKV